MTSPRRASILLIVATTTAFTPPQWNVRKHAVSLLMKDQSTIVKPVVERAEVSSSKNNKKNVLPPFAEIAATYMNGNSGPLTDELRVCVEQGIHPVETQEELGRGAFIAADWRDCWNTYAAEGLIDPDTGYANYVIDDIEGVVPDDLVGVWYRNGSGKFGVGGERVQHVLDADGLITKIDFPPPHKGGREFTFTSRFVETQAFVEEREADKFLYRGTFGTGPPAFFDRPERKGLDAEPSHRSLISRVVGQALKMDIKNSANTHVISFGGKLLALFEAGLPHAIDPKTLHTIGEDDLGGALKSNLPITISGLPEGAKKYMPDMLTGGHAHTAHPQMCPKTGNLVGWHWSQLVTDGALQVTVTEWSEQDFSPVAQSTFALPDCQLAPHDMAITDNYIILKANALQMNKAPFMLGAAGPAASLNMDGQAPVTAWVLPRPTSDKQFEPIPIQVPACFSIHFSHAYEDPNTGHIVTYFSGWPPSDSTDFLGAWGGFCPQFEVISPTYLWRLELDTNEKSGGEAVALDIAPGAANACFEFPVVHPNFVSGKAQYIYGVVSNAVGDSSAPCGFGRVDVLNGSKQSLPPGEFNSEMDAYWFGTRYFTDEPLVVPKFNADPNDETQAYLIGIVYDGAQKNSFVAIFDLERPLSSGPVCRMRLKSHIPHGLHGCFAVDDKGGKSVFC